MRTAQLFNAEGRDAYSDGGSSTTLYEFSIDKINALNDSSSSVEIINAFDCDTLTEFNNLLSEMSKSTQPVEIVLRDSVENYASDRYVVSHNIDANVMFLVYFDNAHYISLFISDVGTDQWVLSKQTFSMMPNSYISEAPTDGEVYSRLNGSWTKLTDNGFVVDLDYNHTDNNFSNDDKADIANKQDLPTVLNKTNAELANLELTDNMQINVTDGLLNMNIISVSGVGIINFVAGVAANIILPSGTGWNGGYTPTIVEGKFYVMTYAFGTFYIDGGR